MFLKTSPDYPRSAKSGRQLRCGGKGRIRQRRSQRGRLAMRVPLEITFGKSPAAHYQQAVQLAKSFTSYRQTGTGRSVIHMVRVTVSLAHEATWEKLNRLLHWIRGWRSTRLAVAGQRVRYPILVKRLVQVKACYARKVQHGAGGWYCSGKQAPADEAAY